MRKYETTFIIDSLIKNEEIEGIITKVEKFISNNGGTVESIERWGKRRLAYEIKKRQYGFYVHVIYEAPNKLNKLLDREYQLDENVLRYLTLVVDPRAELAAEARRIAAAKEAEAEAKAEVETDEEKAEVVAEESAPVEEEAPAAAEAEPVVVEAVEEAESASETEEDAEPEKTV